MKPGHRSSVPIATVVVTGVAAVAASGAAAGSSLSFPQGPGGHALCLLLVCLFLDTAILPLASTRYTNRSMLQRLERARPHCASATCTTSCSSLLASQVPQFARRV